MPPGVFGSSLLELSTPDMRVIWNRRCIRLHNISATTCYRRLNNRYPRLSPPERVCRVSHGARIPHAPKRRRGLHCPTFRASGTPLYRSLSEDSGDAPACHVEVLKYPYVLEALRERLDTSSTKPSTPCDEVYSSLSIDVAHAVTGGMVNAWLFIDSCSVMSNSKQSKQQVRPFPVLVGALPETLCSCAVQRRALLQFIQDVVQPALVTTCRL